MRGFYFDNEFQRRRRRQRDVATTRWLLAVFALLLVLFAVIWASSPAVHAQALLPEQGYTTDDTFAALDEVASESGVSYRYLRSIVACETGGTYAPYSVGRQGELGPVQLHPKGELMRFYAWGYRDPYSPYQAIAFLAARLQQGGARAWSCA